MKLHAPSRRPLSALAVALAVACVTDVARAASPHDAAAAQALFDEAKALMAAGRFGDACPKLEESQRLDPAGGTLLNLARCYEESGRIASAWSTYLEAASASRATGHADREALARRRAEAIEPRVSKLVIVVAPGAQVDGVQVMRDGTIVGQPQWEVAIAVDPGRHEVVARAPGRQAFRQTVDVGAQGQVHRVTVLDLDPVDRAGHATGGDAADDGLGAQRIAALALGSVGVVGLGVGAVFGIQSLSSKSDADEFCDGAACRDPRGIELREDAITQGTISTIGFAVGAVGVAGGVVLWVAAGDDTERPVALGVRPDGVFVKGAF